MIRKLFTLIYKDTLVILNDKAGLGYLFAMPVLLVFIMVVIQDSSFKSVSDFNIKIIVLNNDKDSLGNTIVNELKKNRNFAVTEIFDVKNEKFEEYIAKGEYKIGIIVHDSTTYRMKRAVNMNTARMLSTSKKNNLYESNSVSIEIFFDPITQASYKLMVLSMLREYSAKIENRMMMNEIQKRIPFNTNSFDSNNIISYKERYASVKGALIIPNSVQHNVPAWTLFAMFFIVMSLAGNMIKEREDGSFTRLSLMPFPMHLYLLSKVIIYLIVGLLQFLLMIFMGVYILPLFGFPALNIGGKHFSLLLTGFISALAAIGYALMVGTFTKTYQQSSTFGSISVVIFAAIGGIWVPVIAMPPFMQSINAVSPLN
ncbi:MAG: ABC transporter permease [Draconibacterium sp.]|nr:ABC transporter permease [Draconibacterium sp.]